MKKKSKTFINFDAEIRGREVPDPMNSEILHVFLDPYRLDVGCKERYVACQEKVP